MSGNAYIIRPSAGTFTVAAGAELVFGPNVPAGLNSISTSETWAGFALQDDTVAGNVAVYFNYSPQPQPGDITRFAVEIDQASSYQIDPVWQVGYDTTCHIRNVGAVSRTLKLVVYNVVGVIAPRGL